jgi:hypothetical protein
MASGSTINSFLTSEALKFMFGLPLEAHGGHAGDVARTLHARGARSSETAAIRGDVRAYAPTTGDPFHEMLVMERSGRVFVLAVEWPGKADPKSDALMARLLGDRAPAPREARPIRDRPRTKAFALDSEADLDRLVADARADLWRTDRLFSMTSSVDVSRDGWLAGNATVGSAGLDSWMEFFGALRQCLTHAGAPLRVEAAAQEMGSRTWIRADMADYDAARELGTALAKADGFLPDRTCAAGLAMLYAVQAEMNVAKFVDDGWFDRIHATCMAQGHVDDGSTFDFNDCDDHVFAGERAGGRVLSFRDDNYRTVVEIAGEAAEGTVTVSAASADGDDEPKPIARLAIGNGKVRALQGPRAVGDDILAWNSFVSVVESADCVLENVYGAPPAP